MIPPRSFVSSVYCASRPDLGEIVRSVACSSSSRGPLDVELAHVRDVEDAAVGAHGAVLRDHTLVLDGHLPAGERHQPRAERDVALVSGVRWSVWATPTMLTRLRQATSTPERGRRGVMRGWAGAADRVKGLTRERPTL